MIAEAPLSTPAEAAEACEAAARAFEGWRNTPAPVRGAILFKVQRRMEERRQELAEALTREEGKTLSESRGEIQRAINVVEFFAGEARRITGETIPSELPHNFCYTVKQPVGAGRHHHAVELPGRDPDLEDGAGARLGQHRRLQAGVADAADGRAHRRDLRRVRACRQAC